MVIKTETCFYTEMKIWPGKGRRFIRRDGKYLAFIDQKARSLFNQKIKSQRLTWTQAWRRKNKKGKVEMIAKKKARRTVRVFRTIQGITMEDLKKKRDVKPEVRAAQRETEARELKEAQKKKAEEKKKAKANIAAVPGAAKAPKTFVKVPKSRRLAGKHAVKTGGR